MAELTERTAKRRWGLVLVMLPDGTYQWQDPAIPNDGTWPVYATRHSAIKAQAQWASMGLAKERRKEKA